MPAATTHVEFARDVYAQLPEEQKKKITNKQLFYLGSQGPDVLFFSKFSYLPGSLHKYGNQMHVQNVREVLGFIRDYVEDVPELISYYYGFLCHYALDSTAHPLINAMAERTAEMFGVSVNEAHVHSEADLDVLVMEEHGMSVKDYHVYDDVKVSRDTGMILAVMYRKMFADIFHIDLTLADLQESVHGVSRLTRLLRPNNLKYKFLYRLESLAKISHATSGMMLDHKQPHGLMVMNEDHDEYVYEDIRDNRSFMELYTEAIGYAQKLIEHLDLQSINRDFNGTPIV